MQIATSTGEALTYDVDNESRRDVDEPWPKRHRVVADGSRPIRQRRDCHRGASVITVRIATRVDLPLMPDVLGGDRPSFALDATHTVPIGQYQEVGDVAS